MSDILQFLQQRNSSPRLIEPAPSGHGSWQSIFRAAVRAPDHGWLRPWRFITIAGERRQDFGEVLERCLLARTPDADEAAPAEGAQRSPAGATAGGRGGEAVRSIPRCRPCEQRLSAACAAQAILLAAEACGFAGIWRTGDGGL